MKQGVALTSNARTPPHVFEAADNRILRRPLGHLREAMRYRAFFGYWVRRNLLTRYRQTTLGPLWAVLQPVLGSLIYGFVFAFVLRVDTGPVPYPAFVVVNLVLWNYFARTIVSGAGFFLGNIDLVTRVQFPREMLPLGVWAESLADLLPGSLVVALFFFHYHVSLTPHALLVIPIFAVHTALTLGLTLLVAALSIVVRDLLYIVPLVLQLVMYLSPVVYPAHLVPAPVRSLYFVNPLGVIFAAYQEVLLYGRFTLGRELTVGGLVSVLLLVAGYLVFKRLEWRLADVL